MEKELVIVIVVTIINIACFITGAKTNKIATGTKEIKIPNPKKVIENHKKNRKEQEKQERFEIMMENIDKYDGTEMGQQDI